MIQQKKYMKKLNLIMDFETIYNLNNLKGLLDFCA